ncbi:HlyD family secretion protein [Tistlia consotensis]|uniref:HlyD family secretion protein n=1 Tax=Tistlia consotensis USBA 355 TaxID=560819 RepID=A0A1Y6CER3_9PROT|nr:HlyD family efflux transporter periplasmic adaptor subunit [Tistlia consotensis]SMF60321.1 HlyD family secretion protein [Tistlia consotensis USBA 355]SNR93550.1 HlyD family secretion protein [Tistlia consotensis]
MSGVIAWLGGLLAAVLPGVSGPQPVLGYVEGDYLYLASSCSGQLTALSVADGDEVAAGAPLFRVEDDQRAAELASARAQLANAEATLRDREAGERPEELQVIEQQLAGARADRKLAELSYERSKRLSARDVASQAKLDEDRAQLGSTGARVRELEAQLAVARLPARSQQIAAAEAEVEASRAAVARARADLEDCKVAAPAAGRIERTFLDPGEQAGPSTPVVSLLPPDKLKVRFYVPEARRSEFPLGSAVLVGCDGCGGPIRASVTWQSSQAEYTPPVIYSLDERGRLVFLVEARPENRSPALLPGQPVDVRPAR